MPDRCCSVLSADRSAASIARALPSSRISTVPAADAVAVVDQLLDPDVAVERAEEGGGDLQPGDDDRLAAVHLGGEARVGGDRRVRRDVAARAQILGQHAPDEFLQVELGGSSAMSPRSKRALPHAPASAPARRAMLLGDPAMRQWSPSRVRSAARSPDSNFVVRPASAASASRARPRCRCG